MQLYIEILSKIIEKEKIEITFPNLKISATQIIELECYKALQKIKDIIKDERIDDEDCFMKIEEIICLFEEMGCDNLMRHDF